MTEQWTFGIKFADDTNLGVTGDARRQENHLV